MNIAIIVFLAIIVCELGYISAILVKAFGDPLADERDEMTKLRESDPVYQMYKKR